MKYKDSKSPIVFYTIGSIVVDRALLDLKGSVNLLSYSLVPAVGIGRVEAH